MDHSDDLKINLQYFVVDDCGVTNSMYQYQCIIPYRSRKMFPCFTRLFGVILSLVVSERFSVFLKKLPLAHGTSFVATFQGHVGG